MGMVAVPCLFLVSVYIAANVYSYPVLGSPIAQEWSQINTTFRAGSPSSSSDEHLTIPSSNEIECYRESEYITPVATTFDTCKKIWQSQIRRFPMFYDVQEFLENVRPKIRQPPPFSGKPPFIFTNDEPPSHDCAIAVDATDRQQPDWFSWAQVKDAAQQIMDADGCGSPSAGGRIRIGMHRTWRVRVFGYNKSELSRAAMQSMERPFMLENHTLTDIVDAIGSS